MARTPEDYAHELDALDAAHAQNEAGRDAFVALAHTALFAASVSFVGDITPLDVAVWRPALILGWLASVVGLLALTISFGVARKTIDERRDALNDDEAPDGRFLEQLNGVALWSFPVALLCLFSFVTANVVNSDARQTQPAATSEQGAERIGTAAESAQPQRGPVEALDGRGPGSTSTGSATTAPTVTSPL